jgi:hypothetical protein
MLPQSAPARILRSRLAGEMTESDDPFSQELWSQYRDMEVEDHLALEVDVADMTKQPKLKQKCQANEQRDKKRQNRVEESTVPRGRGSSRGRRDRGKGRQGQTTAIPTIERLEGKFSICTQTAPVICK